MSTILTIWFQSYANFTVSCMHWTDSVFTWTLSCIFVILTASDWLMFIVIMPQCVEGSELRILFVLGRLFTEVYQYLSQLSFFAPDDFYDWWVNVYTASYRVGQKTGPFLSVDNLATVSGRKTCDVSKVLEFRVEKCKTCISVRH